MLAIRDRLGVRVGYSDHTKGLEVSLAAVAMGAEVIEKHFTLSRLLPGPDHKASLEPDELADLVSQIRHIESAMGSGIKEPAESEIPNMTVARKSIVASRPIRKGELLTADNLTVKRPGNGVSPMLWDKVIGTTAADDFEYDQLIHL